MAAASVVTTGVPGFFQPRFPAAYFIPDGAPEALSFYDTSPLADTLNELVDFDYLNERGPRLSVGSVNIKTGNFEYFDSSEMRITPKHVMASGALPPGFPPIKIGDNFYWDGGLVSNTPLQFVLESSDANDLCIFQIDVFSAKGRLPQNLDDVAQREKDIRFSSRTRLTTDRYRQLHDIGAAAARLSKKLPKELKNDADAVFLSGVAPQRAVSLVHLIHRKVEIESQSKDYECSRSSMHEHWAAGRKDAEKTLHHPLWKQRKTSPDAIQVFDLGKRDA